MKAKVISLSRDNIKVALEKNMEENGFLKLNVYTRSRFPANFEFTSNWEKIKNMSYCTNIPSSADEKDLVVFLRLILNEFIGLMESGISYMTSQSLNILSWLLPKKGEIAA